MDYKEYLLKQDAISLAYIAKKMWPTNDNAKSYLSTKLNGKDDKRPWTAGDNAKAEIAIHELGLKLLKDAPNSAEKQVEVTEPKETTVKKVAVTKKPKDKAPDKKANETKKETIWDQMDKLRDEK